MTTYLVQVTDGPITERDEFNTFEEAVEFVNIMKETLGNNNVEVYIKYNK